MTTEYSSEANSLDSELLRIIGAWHRDGDMLNDDAFDDLALRVFAHQLRWNAPYAKYCAAFGITLDAMPVTWRETPALPSQAFKEATIATFDVSRAALAFETSGTTLGTGGRHYMETATLYDAALLAGFDRFMLADGAKLRYLNFVPNPHDRPQSSLGYMMGRVSAERGDDKTGWYVRGDDLFFDTFLREARAAIRDDVPVCIATTAFALVHLCDELERRNAQIAFPDGSRIMETGGFKGRTRFVTREELYERAEHLLGIPQDSITAEYGMTELTSQYYDRPATAQNDRLRVKRSPPWLKVVVVGPDGKPVPNNVVGALVHLDLANRSSCLAVQTEDLGALTDDGLILLGREQGAALRGCSLDAEMLAARR